MNVNKEKIAKLQAMAGAVRVGGKGTIRRKKKTVHKNAGADDKKLQMSLKRLGVQPIPAIDEVTFFKEGDNNVLHFTSPKVMASLQANTFVVTGEPEEKTIADILPSLLSGMGPANMDMLKEMAEKLGAQGGAEGEEAEGDDDVPELAGDFQEAAEKDA